jgi:hypothetical protein
VDNDTKRFVNALWAQKELLESESEITASEIKALESIAEPNESDILHLEFLVRIQEQLRAGLQRIEFEIPNLMAAA